MKLREFADRLFARGRSAGLGAMEVYLQASGQLGVRVFQDQVESYSLAESMGVSFRAQHGGRVGYAYTERLDDESITFLIAEARANATYVDSEDVEEIFAGSDHYAETDLERPEVAGLSGVRLIAMAQAGSGQAHQADSRVRFVNTGFGRTSRERALVNTRGLELSSRGDILHGGAHVVAVQGSERRTGGANRTSRCPERVDPAELAARAVREAVSMFGAAPVPSGAYPVLLRHDVAASLLATFADAFSAESVQRGLSLLTGRLGEAIASPLVTLVDDPFLADGSASAPFDAEGVATVRKEVISSGVLTTYLHNLKTARKDGVRSTGNAARASHKAPVGVAPSNFVLSPGPLQFGELVAAVENGLLVTAVQGLHSGANPVSGDFSLGATGYRIVNGSITAPVDQITLAGNFFRLLAEVEAVGDDLDFTGSFGAPTLRVRALSVAGK